MRITVSKEDYLKAIAEARAQEEPVIAASLARWMGVSPPAVMMAVRRLKRDRLVRVDRKGHLSLSPSGEEIAARVRHRHRLIERMLTEIFGMEWHRVHEEAERLEHAVSEEFERRLIAVLGDDKPCPHGHLSGQESGAERRKLGWIPLDELEPGGDSAVTSVFERDRELLAYFNDLGLRPGCRLRLVSRNCDGTVSIQTGDRVQQLGCGAAAKIWVRPY